MSNISNTFGQHFAMPITLEQLQNYPLSADLATQIELDEIIDGLNATSARVNDAETHIDEVEAKVDAIVIPDDYAREATLTATERTLLEAIPDDYAKETTLTAARETILEAIGDISIEIPDDYAKEATLTAAASNIAAIKAKTDTLYVPNDYAKEVTLVAARESILEAIGCIECPTDYAREATLTAVQSTVAAIDVKVDEVKDAVDAIEIPANLATSDDVQCVLDAVQAIDIPEIPDNIATSDEVAEVKCAVEAIDIPDIPANIATQDDLTALTEIADNAACAAYAAGYAACVAGYAECAARYAECAAWAACTAAYCAQQAAQQAVQGVGNIISNVGCLQTSICDVYSYATCIENTIESMVINYYLEDIRRYVFDGVSAVVDYAREALSSVNEKNGTAEPYTAIYWAREAQETAANAERYACNGCYYSEQAANYACMVYSNTVDSNSSCTVVQYAEESNRFARSILYTALPSLSDDVLSVYNNTYCTSPRNSYQAEHKVVEMTDMTLEILGSNTDLSTNTSIYGRLAAIEAKLDILLART